MSGFKVIADFKPTGDQPNAITQITKNLSDGLLNQILLGVTGSGKTYTIAKVIEETQRPAIIMAPNKTLAAQLYGEFKDFFQIIGLSILFLTTITISLKLMCHHQTPT